MRATTKKLAKLETLGTYFQALGDDDLARAARLFAGRPFHRTNERILSLGWRALAQAIVARAGVGDSALATAYQRHADLGDAAAELIHEAPADQPPPTLADVVDAFGAIAAARGTAAKRALLSGLLARCSGEAARYVVKIVSGETRIGLREGLLEDAIARAFRGEREAVGRAHMLSGDIGVTAVLAKRGALDQARFAHFAPIGMMLATPSLDLNDVERRFPPPYLVEDKYDGVRAQVHKQGERVELYSRTFDRVTDRFPELLPALSAIPGSFVLDAEILSFDERDRAIPFTRFQRRLGRKVVPEALARELPATLVIFDVLERNGVPLLDRPLRERRATLRELPLQPPLRATREIDVDATGEQLVELLDAEFAAARSRGNEGLMVKDPRSPYRPGRRGMEWLKVKRALRTLDVVVTAVEWGHGKRRAVLSDYTFAVRDGARLLNVGKAYSGLTDREIAEMTEHFLAHTREDLGRLRLVEPDTVIEVAFDQIHRSERHDSGYAMRFPRIARLRPDKPVADIDTLDTVRRIAGGEPH